MNSFRNPPLFAFALSLGFLMACCVPQARASNFPQCEGLGLATSFNAFVFEDWSATSSDVEGRIAVGGNLSVNHYSLGDKLDPATAGISVVVGADFTFPSGRLYYGNAVVGGSAAGVGAPVRNDLAPDQTITDHAELPFNFDQVRDQAILRSQAIAELPANGTWVSQWGGLYLTGAPDAALQVFELPAQLVWNAHTFDVQHIPAGATVVFNIRGTSAGLTNMSLQSLASIRRRVLFNFPDAASLTLAGISVEGSILAPLATIQNPQGVIKGNLVAHAWNGMMQLNHEPFEGCGLPDGMHNEPPEIVSSPITVVAEDQSYAYDVDAVDPDNDILAYGLDTAPASAVIDAANGLIGWTPDPAFAQSVRAFNAQCYVVPEGVEQDGDEPVFITPLYQRVREAISRGSDYSGPQTLNWNNVNGCLGCHIQTQTLLGLQASKDKAEVDEEAAEFLLALVLGSQAADGSIQNSNPQYSRNQTAFALWALSYVPDRARTLTVRRNGLEFFRTRVQSSGVQRYWTHDHSSAWLANSASITALVALSANRFVADVLASPDAGADALQTAMDVRALMPGMAEFFLAQSTGNTDNLALSFALLALSELRPNLVDAQLLARLDARTAVLNANLRARQRADGGWGRYTSNNSDPLASAWAGFALDALDPPLTDPVVGANIQYLLDAQQSDGTWRTATGLFATHLATTGLVMAYLPVALEHLGNPDLALGHLQLNEADGHFTLRAEAFNRGLAPADGGLRVRFYAGPPEQGALLGETTLDRLASGETRWAAIDLGQTPPTTHVYATITADTQVGECLENNNATSALLIQVRATDPQGLFDTQRYLLNVEDTNQPPQIVSTPPTELAQGLPYTYRVEVVDPDVGDAHRYELVEGPLGLHLDAHDGKFSYDVAQLPVGTHRVVLRAIDLRGASDEQVFDLSVIANTPPVITSTPPLQAFVGEPYAYPVIATDVDGDALTYTLTASPLTMDIGSQDGLIGWTPQTLHLGIQPVTVKVSDGRGGEAVQTFEIAVTERVNRPPQIVSTPPASVNEGAEYVYDVDAVDPDGDVLTYALDQAPGVASLHGTSGWMAWQAGSAFVQSIRGRNDTCRLPVPPTGPLMPTVKWHWNQQKVLSIPLVGPFFDTNGDGQHDALDRPSIAILSHAGFVDSSGATLRFLDGETGAEISQIPGVSARASAHAAFGDIDNDGAPEIVLYLTNGNVTAVRSSGEVLWTNTSIRNTDGYNYGAIGIEDIDGDGIPEILARGHVLNADGSLRWVAPLALWSRVSSFAADLDGDGRQEVIIGGYVYDADGNLLWQLPSNASPGSALAGVGNFDDDPEPEIAFVVGGTVRLYESDGTLAWGPVAIPGGGGGSPVVADLDGDGYAEVGVAGTSRYVVFDHDGSMIWSRTTQDSSRTTGSTVFDFNGDGRAEIVYGDEQYLRVYDGLSGDVIYQIVNSSATASEYPVIADIDGDGQAELMIVSDRSPTAGIRVLRSANIAWVGTRSIWNQYNYRIDNISDDTSIPSHPEPSWLTHNSFRLNAFPDRHPLGLPDLALFDLRLDESDGTAVRLTVVNRGLAPTSVPTQVRIFNGHPQSGGHLLGSLTVPTLAAGEERALVLDGLDPAAIDRDLHALIDEDDAVTECLENNNRASAAYFQVRASDPEGLYDTQRFTVTVENVNQAPSIQTAELPPATIGEDYRFIVAANDPDQGDGLLFKLTHAPAGLEIEAVSGELRWLPESAHSGAHTVDIQVTDLGGLSDTRTFTLSVVADNRVPRILSVPPTSAQAGIAYSYDMVASDPDGDALTYRLTIAPDGMSMDANGGITWLPTPLQVGSHPVEARVEDGRGGFAEQRWIVTVLPSPNQPPAIVSVPPATIGIGQIYRYAAAAVDPDGDPLTWSLPQSPTGMTIDPVTGLIEWIPEAPGSVPVRVRVSDGGYWVEQGWTLTVLDADVELSATVTVSPQPVAPGGTITVTVIVEGAAGPVALTATLDGEPIVLAANGSTPLTAPTAPGTHTLVVQLSDGHDQTEVVQTFSVIDPNDTVPPVVEIAAPQPGANDDLVILTAPTQVIGTVSDANLVGWRLALVERGAPAGEFIELATGTNNVVAAELGSIDPTLLLNGLYTLVLDAWDHGGHHAQASVPLSIEGDMKLGHFSIGFADLTVPVSGIPITLTRTYDTRQRHRKQDFGQGWRLDHASVRIQESRTPGFGWRLNTYPSGPLGLIPNYCVESSLGNVVSVTLPDGKVEKFKVKASPACNQGAPLLDVNLVFEPMENTHGRLETREPVGGRLNAGSITDIADAVGSIVDPDQYRYIDAEGREYSLDQGWGLRQIHEREGDNTVTFQHDGIVHSNGTRVDYTRDAQGRITTITAPDGTQLHYAYDSSGNLAAFEDAEGNRTTFTYLQNHYLQDIIDPRGVRVSRNEYDAAGRLVAVIDANGNRIEYTRNIAGRVEQITDRNGHTTTYVYNDRGDVLAETNAEGETITRSYDEHGNKLSETDALGNTEHWTYNNLGNVLTHTNAAGETTTSTYGSFNHLIRQTDAAGNVVLENTYNNITLPGTGMEMYPGPLVSMKDANGAITSFGYHPATGELSRLTDATGAITRYEYDAKGYKTADVDALGHRTEYVNDDLGRALTQTRTRTTAQGQTEILVTTYTYDANGNGIATEHPDGSVTTTAYDANGKPIEECDALNRCTTTEYDDRGNVAKITYPDGTEETRTYDPNGNLIAETDRAGRTTKHLYDTANRQIATLHPDDTPNDDSDNPRTENIYDAAGRLHESIDENGHITRYGYDAAGRRTHDYAPDPVTGQPGTEAIAITTYDRAGRRASVTDAVGRTTRFVYDPAGRLTETIHPDETPDDADNPRTRTEYDAAGRKTAEIDEQDRRTEFGYDTLSRLIEVKLAAGTAEQTVTTYGYDELGNKISQTDAEGRTTRWEYDAMGRETARILPNGERETRAYNAAGELIEHTDFNGSTTRYEYDIAGRIQKIDYPTDADVTYTYNAAGERTTATDGRGTSTSTYDTRGRILRAQDADGGLIEYEYDAASNLTARISPSQSQTYQYDARNRLTTATRTVDGEAPSTTSYEYAETGTRTTLTTGDGTRTEYGYDARNHLKAMLKKTATGTLLLAMNYSVDASGLRTGIEESDQTGIIRTVQYQYDGIKRLTRETIDHRDDANDRTAEWTYDKVGNRLTQTQSPLPPGEGNAPAPGEGSVTTYTYDPNDRLITETTDEGTTTYTYDANGNTLTKISGTESVSYSYDNANRLSQATTAAAQTAYAYTADGLRIRQVHAPLGQPITTTWYVQDTAYPYAQVIEEYQSQGSQQRQLTATYTFADELVAQTRYDTTGNPQTNFIQQDGFGSTRWLTDPGGTITDAIDYDAFGNEIARTGQAHIEHLYRGEAFDRNLGFYYLRARWMNPGTGRFVQMDKFSGFAESPLTLNKFGYTNADPVNNLDPSGYSNLAEQMAVSSGKGSMLSIAVPRVVVQGTRLAANDALYATATGVSNVRWAGVGLVTGLALSASSRQRDRFIGVPYIVFGREFEEHAQHIQDAQMGNGSNFSQAPFALNRSPTWPRGWYNVDSVVECNRAARARYSESRACDEYPFASTRQGGPANYMLGSVSLRLLDLSESNGTRNFINRFYSVSSISRDGVSKESRFVAIGAPGSRSFFTDRQGVVHYWD